MSKDPSITSNSDGHWEPAVERVPEASPKFIRFVECAMVPPRKTKAWRVESKDGAELLGEIKWYGGWRKFCFFPEFETLYEETCLRDIAAFCQRQTFEHQQMTRKEQHA